MPVRAIYLVRHGQYESYSEKSDSLGGGLTDLGREQAQLTAAALSVLPVNAIYCSTLRRAAEAMGCELQYALVPKKSLADILEARASFLARQQMAAISHTMALEAQSTSRETVEAQTRALTESLLKGSRRTLWRES